MVNIIINKAILSGIIVFLLGFVIGSFWFSIFQWLIPVGTIITFLGVFYYLKTTDFEKEFEFKKGEGVLEYFWNVLALKIWTLIISLWMIFMNYMLITEGNI